MKKILLFLYDSFAEFEIVTLVTALRGTEYELVTFSTKPEGEAVEALSTLRYLPNLTIQNIVVDEFEALVIPGGTPHPLLQNQELSKLIRSFYEQNKLLAAICGGPSLLGAAGILKEITYTASIEPTEVEYKEVMNWENKLNELLVVDKNVITATGSNYLNFAEEVLRKLGGIPQDDENPLQYFREPSKS
ncbi:DJ-1/PfpI family protein [Brevibacillus sp. GCM10020057]|uniref:DJ-1/PfpI family protein n=1 Tax=Brevibacillus sp. GCM10020057 TaxID=3317327 RepID=UPI00364517CA